MFVSGMAASTGLLLYLNEYGVDEIRNAGALLLVTGVMGYVIVVGWGY